MLVADVALALIVVVAGVLAFVVVVVGAFVVVATAAADVQGYAKPKMVHVARFWSSSLGIVRAVPARASTAVVVKNFILMVEGVCQGLNESPKRKLHPVKTEVFCRKRGTERM